jgi:sulfur carrier protein
MQVIVNGQRRELSPGATISDAVALLARDGGRSPEAAGRGVAVAVDGEVVPRDEWSCTGLGEGARVEVLAAIQGGAQ